MLRDLLARLQLEVASLPDDHLPETLKSGLLKLTRWMPHHSSPVLFTFPRGKISLSLFSGTMRRLTSLEPEHVTAAKKYICDGINVIVMKEIHL